MPARPVFQRGTARANRVGVMMLAATLCQWLIPATSLFFLRLMGVDTAADHWGLPHVQYLLTYAVLYILMLGVPLVLCRIFLAPQEKPHSRRRLSVDQTVCLIAVGTALCLLANILSALFCDWLYSLGIPKPQLSLPDDGSLITLLLDLTVFALLPALLEEALLRGLILKTLFRRFCSDCFTVTSNRFPSPSYWVWCWAPCTSPPRICARAWRSMRYPTLWR